jgi:hypothetical protein
VIAPDDIDVRAIRLSIRAGPRPAAHFSKQSTQIAGTRLHLAFVPRDLPLPNANQASQRGIVTGESGPNRKLASLFVLDIGGLHDRPPMSANAIQE